MNPKYDIFQPARPQPGATVLWIDLTKESFTLEMKVLDDDPRMGTAKDRSQTITRKGTRKHIIAAVILHV